MKRYIVAAAMAGSIGLSLPAVALAQDVPPPYPDNAPPGDMHDRAGPMDRVDRPGGDWSLDRREQWLDGRIERAVQHGRLSGNEERRGRGELDAIRTEQDHLTARDGGALSEADRSYVAHRIDELNGALRWEGENPPPPWSYR